MRKNNSHPLAKVWDYVVIVAASFIYGLGLYAFTVPAKLAAGGVSGIFTIVHYLTGFPVGLGIFLINIPLILAGFFIIGKEFIIKTAVGTLVSSVAIDYIFPAFLPAYEGDRFLSALFGGLLIGLGIGLLYARGGSSGGTDIVCRIIKRKFPFMRIGNISLIVDLIIVAAATVVFKEIEEALLAAVCLFVISFVIDRVVNGVSEGSFVFIITDRKHEVAKRILKDLDRGCTIVESEGAYSSEEKGTILCAVRDNERHKLTDVAHEADPNAFIVVTKATDVLGNGFERSLR